MRLGTDPKRHPYRGLLAVVAPVVPLQPDLLGRFRRCRPFRPVPIYILGAAGVLLTGRFVLAERRAAEPIVPLHLFKLRTFSVTSAAGFIVGLAIGAITYLPVFFQVIRGISPTVSGVYLLPLMAGLLLVSVASGWRRAVIDAGC